MLQFMRLVAIIASGFSVGMAAFDGFLHARLFFRNANRRKHAANVLTRWGYAITMGVILWEILIPSPVQGWGTPVAWAFTFGLIMSAFGLAGVGAETYWEYAETFEEVPSG